MLGTISLFSVIVLALSADWINTTETITSAYDPFAALALAVALLSLLTLPIMSV